MKTTMTPFGGPRLGPQQLYAVVNLSRHGPVYRVLGQAGQQRWRGNGFCCREADARTHHISGGTRLWRSRSKPYMASC